MTKQTAQGQNRWVCNGSILVFAFMLLSVDSPRGRAAESEASGLGGVVPVPPNQPQLFVDNFLIESQSELKRTLHQPVKENGGRVPLIASRPGESFLAYGTILRDPKLQRYVMYAKNWPPFQMYRLTSPDGLDWGPPESHYAQPIPVSLVDEKSGRKATNTDMFCVHYDEKDAEYPYKAWMWFSNWGDDLEGIFYMCSRDGITWERRHQIVDGWAGGDDPTMREIRQDGRVLRGPGDVTLFAYDPLSERYLGIFKFFTPYRIDPATNKPAEMPEGVRKKDVPGNELRSRAYGWLDRLDARYDTKRIERIALLPAAQKANGDMPFDEYYQSTAWRYGSMWLGGLKIWHSRDDYPYSAAGCAFLKLVSSRDGLNWKKVPFPNDSGTPEVFLPNGPEGGNDGRNDGGYISEFTQGPLRIGDELIYYYSASSWGKVQAPDVRIRGGGIFRARLRVDGFVSVDAGTLTTRPLTTEAEHLYVNGVGPIEVAIIDATGKTRAQARLTGDSLEHPVRFEGKSLREKAPAGSLRLRFSVSDGGRLYSFTVR